MTANGQVLTGRASRIVRADSGGRLYTRQFFHAFVAVAVFMTGAGLQFHFGQYVEFLGYGVDVLGRILSISMVGALLIRLHVGRWIDRFGCRPTWLFGSLVVGATIALLQVTRRLEVIVLLRTVWAMATAAVMTGVSVYAAQIAPQHRRAESIGTMGLAGFFGMMVGPLLGDWIFAGPTDTIAPFRLFFWTSALCSVLAGLFAFWVMPRFAQGAMNHLGTVHGEAEQPEKTVGASVPHQLERESKGGSDAGPTQLSIIRAHWPGPIMFVGVVFNMVFCLQSVYLERLAEDRGFHDIGLFFLVYGPTAMMLRLGLRRLPERLGRSRTLLTGLVLLTLGLVAFVGVYSQGHLVLPGLLMGAGHALVFPSMVDLAAGRMPFHHRGTATAVILGAGDLGMLLGYVALGELIEAWGFNAALVALAVSLLAATAVFALTDRTEALETGLH